MENEVIAATQVRDEGNLGQGTVDRSFKFQIY